MKRSAVKNIVDGVPLAFLLAVGGGLFLLSMYSVAAISVVEHVKSKVLRGGQKTLQAAFREQESETPYKV